MGLGGTSCSWFRALSLPVTHPCAVGVQSWSRQLLLFPLPEMNGEMLLGWKLSVSWALQLVSNSSAGLGDGLRHLLPFQKSPVWVATAVGHLSLPVPQGIATGSQGPHTTYS